MPVRIKGTDLVYFPVPKVACTSIKEGILKHNDPLKWEYVKNVQKKNSFSRIHEIYGTTEINFITMLGLWFGRRWFCVVRDPVSRFVSGYRNRIAHYRDLEKSVSLSGLSANPTINEFAAQLSEYCANSAIVSHHFSPQTSFLGAKSERFERVFNIRQIDELRSYLAGNGVEVEFPRAQDVGPKMSVAELSQEAQDALRHFYRDDYRVFGEFFEQR